MRVAAGLICSSTLENAYLGPMIDAMAPTLMIVKRTGTGASKSRRGT